MRGLKQTKEPKEVKVMPAAKIKKMTIIELVEQIVGILEDSELQEEALVAIDPYCVQLAKKYDITGEQAMWLAMFINWFDDSNVRVADFARFLNCKPITVLRGMEHIDALKKKGYVYVRQDSDNDYGMRLPNDFMAAVRQDKAYVPQSFENLTAEKWFDRLEELLEMCVHGDLDYNTYRDNIGALKASNKHLQIVQRLKTYKITDTDEDVLFRTMCNFITDNDEQIVLRDIADVLPNHRVAKEHARAIGRGIHRLQLCGLIENVNEEGCASAQAWHLTDKAKNELLAELDIAPLAKIEKGLITPESLAEKKLYFNADVTKAVKRLRNLLSQEQLGEVQNRLEKRGMRRGFTCIFYGGPGTGKTETVYQLARETGRSIMMVDMPSMRSKWVGDSEKNIKALFDRYRALVKKMPVAPILLFNEADAVISKRTEITDTNPSVEKMENSMQNIILQEMENLDGIMIATTNLTENLDGAFERRFLYKIEFPKPSPDESKHIWQAMLPDLNEEQALDLAKHYSFSGGQIENIARKQVVDAVLNGDEELNMETVREACACELLKNKQQRAHVGFA